VNAKEAARDFRARALVRAVGDGLSATVEQHANPDEVDHVWIRMDVGGDEPLVISVNTFSKRNLFAGFDPRVRVATLRGTWETLPPRGLSVVERFDYAAIETSANVFFEHRERVEIETFIIERCSAARMLEVIGAPYASRRPGLHQVHSRRASCAVTADVVGLDGALRFYFEPPRETEWVLFKFCGQV